MQITATQLKQQTHLLDRAVVEDIQVTKRNRPFVVIVDAKRYEELIANQKAPHETVDDIMTRVQGIIPPDIDPVAWQNQLREEEERDPYGDVKP